MCNKQSAGITWWIYYATEQVTDKKIREDMQNVAFSMCLDGALRGDISEFWMKHYAEKHTSMLRDLYL